MYDEAEELADDGQAIAANDTENTVDDDNELGDIDDDDTTATKLISAINNILGKDLWHLYEWSAL